MVCNDTEILIIGYCSQAGFLAALETYGILPTITERKAWALRSERLRDVTHSLSWLLPSSRSLSCLETFGMHALSKQLRELLE